MSHLTNVWGQRIDIGDTVGYICKTGSYTTRKVGIVTGFGVRKNYRGEVTENTVLVHWSHEQSYQGPRKVDEQGKGVGIDTVFRLDPASLTRL